MIELRGGSRNFLRLGILILIFCFQKGVSTLKIHYFYLFSQIFWQKWGYDPPDLPLPSLLELHTGILSHIFSSPDASVHVYWHFWSNLIMLETVFKILLQSCRRPRFHHGAPGSAGSTAQTLPPPRNPKRPQHVVWGHAVLFWSDRHGSSVH